MESRREREIEEMKELILKTASDIVTEEGYEKLSIRKIANRIEYAPSIIYHYFKDKNEILNIIMERGYKKITTAVDLHVIKNRSPEEKLILMTKNYIKAALDMPDQFIAVQLSPSKEIQKHTSSLFKGASKEKPALASLYQCLKEIYKEEETREEKIELTAQIIAVSTLGLIIKLIVEKDIGEEQKEKLINFYSKDIILRIANLK